MATKKEIKEVLKELNLTELDMDNFWEDLKESNATARLLNKCGKTWRDMNAGVIKSLPTQKERDLENAERKAQEEKEKAEIELKAKQDREYYYNHFDEIILSKIDKGEELTEDELSTIRDYSIEDIEGDESRWSRDIESIIELCGRTFSLSWSRGLTECQENSFYNQPHEVEKKTTIKTITVVEWISKTK